MIQIQDTKFVFNWIKKDADYPRYERIRTEFKHHLDEFRKFLDREGLDPIEENQWELTYVNHVPAGDLWNSPTDWPSLLPGLLSSNTKLGPAKLESIRGEWRGEIGKQLGRLHLAIRGQERPLEAGGIEKLLVLHMTARGPMEVGADPCDGLDVGHDAIVSAFLDMTSTEAQEHWGRKK
jgi:uncharacterized protein (TIGR04255 family)